MGTTLAPRVRAQEIDDATRNAARELAQDGVNAYEAGQYEHAVDLLKRAFALMPAPTISIYEARALSRLGRLVEAAERYEATRRMPLPKDPPPAFSAAVSDATRELEALRERTPKLRITVEGPGAELASLAVQLDGKPVPHELLGVFRTVNPGAHRIEATVPGVSRGSAEVESVEGKSTPIVVVLARTGESAPTNRPQDQPGEARGSGLRTWGWVAVGVGVVGIGVGAGAALVARSKQSDLDSVCDSNRCPPSAQDDLDSFHSARTVSFVGYGVGVVGIATGAVLLLVPSGERSARRISPFLGSNQAGVMGRF